jgi:hypothetical protein
MPDMDLIVNRAGDPPGDEKRIVAPSLQPDRDGSRHRRLLGVVYKARVDAGRREPDSRAGELLVRNSAEIFR